MEKRIVQLPLTEETKKSLKAGDIVYLSGRIFNARSRWYLRVVQEGRPLPVDIHAKGVGAIFHGGPIVKKKADGSYQIKSLVPMPGWVMNGEGGTRTWQAVEKIGLDAIVCKGMIDGSSTYCKKLNCVHFAAPGTWIHLAKSIVEVKEVHWEELGYTEAMWIFEIKEMGPFIVETDADGVSLYDQVKDNLDDKINKLYEREGLKGFKYSLTP